jgi:hypothetical protein
MKRFALLPLAFLLAAPALLADFPQEMAQADLLHKHDAHEEARTMLEAVLGREAGGREQAEIYWRLARAWLNLGDQAEDKGAGAMPCCPSSPRARSWQKGIEAVEQCPISEVGHQRPLGPGQGHPERLASCRCATSAEGPAA